MGSVTSWKNVSNFWCPVSVDSNCPYCRRNVNFSLGEPSYDQVRRTTATTSRCSGCRQSVHIWVVDPGPANDMSKQTASCIAMFPGPQDDRGPIDGVDLIPEQIRRAYLESLQVHNAKVWSATATLCRRTLEGLALHLTSGTQTTGRPTLASMLREIAMRPDLGRPIAALADSVRLGGNLGTHFDTDFEPDEELATTMLNLLEYLLEYFFTIPSLIHTAQAVLDRPRQAGT